RHLPGGFLCPAVEISVSAATTARATRPGRLDDLPLLRLAGVATAAACHLAKRLEQIDWEGEHGGRIVLGRDLGERLQVAKLERDRAFAHYFRRLGQALRRLKFALGRDHLGAPFALGLGLRSDRALHVLRQVNVLELDEHDLDSPRLGLGIDDRLDARVDFVALAQELVEFGLPAYGAQRGLRELHGGEQVICHLGDCARRIDHPEVEHRTHLDGHVVLGDYVLRRDVEHYSTQIDPDHPLNQGDHVNYAWAAIPHEPPEAEDYGALVFVKDFDPAQNKNCGNDDDYTGCHCDSPCAIAAFMFWCSSSMGCWNLMREHTASRRQKQACARRDRKIVNAGHGPS